MGTGHCHTGGRVRTGIAAEGIAQPMINFNEDISKWEELPTNKLQRCYWFKSYLKERNVTSVQLIINRKFNEKYKYTIRVH